MNADWKVGKAQYAEFNVPTCGKIAVWLLCREAQPLWKSHDLWWPELMPWCSFPWHKLLPSLAQKTCCTVSLNLIHELTSLFSPKVIFAGSLRKAFPRKHAFVDISVFLWLGKQRPRFAQGQPKGYLQLKELHRTSMLIDRWGRLSMLNSMCQHVASLQFDYCAEKHSLCGTVMIHGGLKLTCLDQCHGVRSCSFPWHKLLAGAKRGVVQSKFDPWVYILVFAEGI